MLVYHQGLDLACGREVTVVDEQLGGAGVIAFRHNAVYAEGLVRIRVLSRPGEGIDPEIKAGVVAAHPVEVGLDHFVPSVAVYVHGVQLKEPLLGIDGCGGTAPVWVYQEALGGWVHAPVLVDVAEEPVRGGDAIGLSFRIDHQAVIVVVRQHLPPAVHLGPGETAVARPWIRPHEVVRVPVVMGVGEVQLIDEAGAPPAGDAGHPVDAEGLLVIQPVCAHLSFRTTAFYALEQTGTRGALSGGERL